MCIQLWQGANAGKIRTAVGVSSCSPGWSNPCGCCAVGGCSVHRSWRCSCEPMGICSAKFLVALLGSVSFLFNALLSPTVVWCSSFLQLPWRCKGEKYCGVKRRESLSISLSSCSDPRFRQGRMEDSLEGGLRVCWERMSHSRGGGDSRRKQQPKSKEVVNQPNLWETSCTEEETPRLHAQENWYTSVSSLGSHLHYHALPVLRDMFNFKDMGDCGLKAAMWFYLLMCSIFSKENCSHFSETKPKDVTGKMSLGQKNQTNSLKRYKIE